MSSASPWLRRASLPHIGGALDYLWVAWVAMGVLTGKDLSWQFHPERLTVFPVRGFGAVYGMWLAMGFLSVPMLFVLALFEVLGVLKGGGSAARLLETFAASILFVASVRLTVSLVRSTLFRGGAVRRSYLICMLSVSAVIAGSAAMALMEAGGAPEWFPGHALAAVLCGLPPTVPLLRIAAIAILLALADFQIQKELAYAGLRGPSAAGGGLISGGAEMLLGGSWPGPFFGISLLGWLRNRNALLLLVWGTVYGFFYTWFTRPGEAFYFFGFVWMMLIFHSYLRGNLLGIDRGGAWFYYMTPLPVASAISARNASLSVIQGIMVSAVFLPVLIHTPSQMTATAWCRVLSYAVCAMLVGEISGSVFSLRNPDPIERESHYSGGMTAGALLVPMIQLAFLAVFVIVCGLARLYLPNVLGWCLLAALPAVLFVVRSTILAQWIRRTMLQEREAILQKLAVFSS